MQRLLTAGLLLILLVGGIERPLSAEPEAAAFVARISFTSPAQLALLAQSLDIWEVDAAAQMLRAYVTPAEAAWLTETGFVWQPEAQRNAHPATIPGFPCYRTIVELDAQLQAWAETYPTLTELFTIGASYAGRPLWVLHLTNFALEAEKPVFFLIANIHGRELITNETAMEFIALLLDGYGIDPDVTWVLDHHSIYVLVSANPDGHVKNEVGEPWVYWRKNTQPYGNCGSTGYGADLNRNADFKWGGASTNPCADTYQGPSAASESETQAIQNFMRTLFPDQRGPGDTAPAPEDATGVFITLHSYGNLLLWPWGHTYTAAPNATQLEMLGRKMAAYNGYAPGQSSTLYPTTGATDDWAYGELGIAAYTYEIGTFADGFYPSCSRYAALITPNLPALFYAAKVARTPYHTAFGPDAVGVRLTPETLTVGEPVQVQAVISDTANGNQPIVAAEVYVDAPPWAGGSAQPLLAVDGAFDAPVEAVWGAASTAGLPAGRHLIYVRGRDADGYWGPVSAHFVTLNSGAWQWFLPVILRGTPPGTTSPTQP